MRETVMYCDHCGKDIDPMIDYEDIHINMDFKWINADLCIDCLDELYKLVSDFVKKKG